MPELVRSEQHQQPNVVQTMKAGNQPAPATEATTASYLKATSSESTDILEKRLESWRTVVKDLISYFDELADTEISTSKGLEKSAGYIVIPFKEANFFGDDSKPGIQNYLAEIRNHSHQLASSHKNIADVINNQTIKDLKILRDDIKSRIKEVKSDHNSLNSKLAKTRDNSISHYRSLNRATSETEELTSADKDPWLVNHSFQRQLQRDVSEENNYNKAIVASINSLENFEESIVTRIKMIIERYYSLKHNETLGFDKQAELINEKARGFDNLTDWRAFSERNPDVIPSSQPSIRTVDDLTKPFESTGLLETVKTGVLERKSGIGMFKSWKDYFFVLTGSGFLHAFSSSDYHSHKEPEFSIPLRKSTLSPHLEDMKESPYAFEITDQSGGGMFSNEKTYLLRAKDQRELEEWYGAISNKAERTLSVHNRDGSAVPYATGALGAVAGAGMAHAAGKDNERSFNKDGDYVQSSTLQNTPSQNLKAQAPHDSTLGTVAGAGMAHAARKDNERSFNRDGDYIQGSTLQNTPSQNLKAQAPHDSAHLDTLASASPTAASGLNNTLINNNASSVGNQSTNNLHSPDSISSTQAVTGAPYAHPTSSTHAPSDRLARGPPPPIPSRSEASSDPRRRELEAAGLGALGGAAGSSLVSDHRSNDAQRMLYNNAPKTDEVIRSGDYKMNDDKRTGFIGGDTMKSNLTQNSSSYPDQVTITSQGQDIVYIPADSKDNVTAGPLP